MGAVYLALMVASTALQVLYVFVYPLIVDRQLSGLEAVKLSFKAAFANFGGILGLIMLTTLMSMIGVLACYVGAFLIMPIHFAAIAVAYRQVFPARMAYDDRVLEEEGEPGPPAAATPETTDFQERPRRDRIQ